MLPITQIPSSIWKGLQDCRELFCRDAGFEHIGRYITGLIVSPDKTLQGIHDMQVWPEDKQVSSRAMHEAVFEAGRQSDELMPRHRKQVSTKYKGKGRYTISIDWTYSHHTRGPEIYGVKKGFDYAKGGYGLFLTVLTAAAANARRRDGIETEILLPAESPKEKACLKATAGQERDSPEAAHERMPELLHYHAHRQAYRKITEI